VDDDEVRARCADAVRGQIGVGDNGDDDALEGLELGIVHGRDGQGDAGGVGREEDGAAGVVGAEGVVGAVACIAAQVVANTQLVRRVARAVEGEDTGAAAEADNVGSVFGGRDHGHGVVGRERPVGAADTVGVGSGEDAVGEAATVGEETAEALFGSAIEGAHLAAARALCCDQVGLLIAVGVGDHDPHAAGEGGVVSEEAPQGSGIHAAVDLDAGRASGAQAGNDIGVAVAVEVPGGHVDAALEGHVGDEEIVQFLTGGAIDNGDTRHAAGAGAGNDVGQAVAIDVASGDVDAVGRGVRVGNEAAEQGAVATAEDLDDRQGADIGAGDDVRVAVAVDIPGRDIDAVGLAGGISLEIAKDTGQRRERGAIENAHLRAAARSGARDDVGHAIAVDVTDRDADAAGEGAGIGEEVGLLLVSGGVEDTDQGGLPASAPVTRMLEATP
jgi:hypothetical protein